MATQRNVERLEPDELASPGYKGPNGVHTSAAATRQRFDHAGDGLHWPAASPRGLKLKSIMIALLAWFLFILAVLCVLEPGATQGRGASAPQSLPAQPAAPAGAQRAQ